MRLGITIAQAFPLLCSIVSFFFFFPVADYRLYQDYLYIQKESSHSFTERDFTNLSLIYKNKPRLLCRLLEKTEEKDELKELANITIDRLIRERKNYSLIEKLDILATIDRLRGFDPRYEEWIISEGLFYFPQEPHFWARQSLLKYEKQANTGLSIQERKKALLLIENMLRSEERS